MELKKLNEIIIKALNNSDLSNYKIAIDTGLSDTAIKNYRIGKNKPNISSAKILANYFGICPNYLGEFEITKPHNSETKTTEITIRDNKEIIDLLVKQIDILQDQIKRLTSENDDLKDQLAAALRSANSTTQIG